MSGCASVVGGTFEGSSMVLLTSTPSGARVTINSVPYGVTPCRIRLNKFNALKELQFEKDGFHSARCSAKDGFNAATLGNVLAGGFIGAGYDLLSGNMVSTKDSIHVDLIRLD